MVFIPFFFFLLYFIFTYRKHGFDVGAYMLLLFLIISTLSVIIRYADISWSTKIDDPTKVVLNLTPTIVYCVLIGLCILPYTRINLSYSREVAYFRGVKFMEVVVWASFFSMLFIFVIYSGEAMHALTSGSMAEVRNTEHDSTPITRLPGILRIVGSIANKIASASFLLIPYYFYSRCFLNKTKVFNNCLLASTSAPLIMSVTFADRSNITFYLLQFALAYLLFKPYIGKELMSDLKKVMGAFVGLLIVYLIYTSLSRFGETPDGNYNFLRYFGMPYMNFCIYWDNLPHPPIYIDIVFPITSTILGLNRGADMMEYVDMIYQTTGVHTNVFPTFIGTILGEMGQTAAIVMAIIFYFCSNTCIKSVRKSGRINLFNIYCIYIFGTINVCGIVSYYYGVIGREVPAFIYLIVMWLFCRKHRTAKLKYSRE